MSYFQVMMTKPDWKCVFTYVQSFYRRFRNGRDPPPPTRVLVPQSDDNQVRKNDSDKNVSSSLFSDKSEAPLSPEKQKSLLSKYMIDDDDEKRSKNRSTFSPKVRSQSFRQQPTRPPLTSSLSLSSGPEKSAPKSFPTKLTSVAEKVSETDAVDVAASEHPEICRATSTTNNVDSSFVSVMPTSPSPPTPKLEDE